MNIHSFIKGKITLSSINIKKAEKPVPAHSIFVYAIKFRIIIASNPHIAAMQSPLDLILRMNEYAFISINCAANNKPFIAKATLRGCGICVSRCPTDAIQIGDVPTVVDFCCQHSEKVNFNCVLQVLVEGTNKVGNCCLLQRHLQIGEEQPTSHLANQ